MSKNILGQTFGNVSIDLTSTNTFNADKLTGTSEIKGTYLTANRGLKTDSNKKLVSTTATETEIEFLQGVSSNIQTQLNAKEPTIDQNNKLSPFFLGSGINANLIASGNINNTDFDNMLIKPGTNNSILRVPTFLKFNQNNGLLTQCDELSDLFVAGTNINFNGFTINSTSDALYNTRNSAFFPTIGTQTPTKAAFDGAIMCRSIINHGQSGDSPSFITFGTRNTNADNEITLGTNGRSRFFVHSGGRVIIGGDDTNTSIPTNNGFVYTLGVVQHNINANANGIYVRCAKNRRALRCDYENNNGDLRPFEIFTPNDGADDNDDFRIATANSIRMVVDNQSCFLAGPSNGQFTVFNFNNSSDDRIKSNETPITNALESIMKLKPYTYDKYDNMEKTGVSYKESGLISQDIWYDAPELRHLIDLGRYTEEDETGMK